MILFLGRRWLWSWTLSLILVSQSIFADPLTRMGRLSTYARHALVKGRIGGRGAAMEALYGSKLRRQRLSSMGALFDAEQRLRITRFYDDARLHGVGQEGGLFPAWAKTRHDVVDIGSSRFQRNEGLIAAMRNRTAGADVIAFNMHGTPFSMTAGGVEDLVLNTTSFKGLDWEGKTVILSSCMTGACNITPFTAGPVERILKYGPSMLPPAIQMAPMIAAQTGARVIAPTRAIYGHEAVTSLAHMLNVPLTVEELADIGRNSSGILSNGNANMDFLRDFVVWQ